MLQKINFLFTKFSLYYHYSSCRESCKMSMSFKGGGGFSPDFRENTIPRLESAMMARTCTNNPRAVPSPQAQHCPCEALEQKWAPKTKLQSKETELSPSIHSTRSDETVTSVH